MGLLPDQYLDLTMKEILRAYKGFQTRQSRDWERFRQLIYMVSCLANDKNKRIDIYDMLPLSTDPTEEERKQMQEEKNQQLREEAKEIFAYYKSKGFLN